MTRISEKVTEDELRELRAILVNERQALESASLKSNESRQPITLDQQRVGRLSRMDAMQSQAMAQASERRRQIRLAKIDIALKRMSSEDYGFCDKCGEEISPNRLKLDPAIAICIACARNTKQ